MIWTKEDQQALDELLERKQSYRIILIDCVGRSVASWYQQGMNADEVRDALIANAESLHKILEPFAEGR